MKSYSRNKLNVIICGFIFALISVISLCNNVTLVNNRPIPEDQEIFELKSSLGSWEPAHSIDVGVNASGVSIGDVNNDGSNNIVVTRPDEDLITVFKYNNNTNEWVLENNIAVGSRPLNVFIGDANNDGFNDIVTANVDDNNVSILCWNDTLSDWDPQTTEAVGSQPRGVFIADVNNDGKNDIITANYGSNDTSILCWNETNGDWDPQIKKDVGDHPRNLFVGDANNDGYNDIVTANSHDNNVSILCWNETLSGWDPQITHPVELDPISVFIGDINNDGYNDIATACLSGNAVSILLWNASISGWNPQFTFTMGTFYPFATSVFIGDVNGDGLNDIVASKVAGYVTIKCWDPIASSWDKNVYKPVGGPITVFVGDVNGDGMNDIVTANSPGSGSGSISIILSKPPVPPILYDILPNPDPGGIIHLNWSSVETANIYYVYRSTSKFTDVSGLKPIAVVADTNYTDIITIDNIYYYAIVSGNTILNSSMSNRDCVTVANSTGLNPLFVEVYNQSFNLEQFEIYFSIFNKDKQEIENVNIQMWWDGDQVPVDNITDLGNGSYSVSLNPVTVLPGDDPILLNMTISLDGYDTKYFVLYLAVDPDTLSKNTPNNGGSSIPGYSILIIMGLFSLISVFLIKHKKN